MKLIFGLEKYSLHLYHILLNMYIFFLCWTARFLFVGRLKVSAMIAVVVDYVSSVLIYEDWVLKVSSVVLQNSVDDVTYSVTECWSRHTVCCVEFRMSKLFVVGGFWSFWMFCACHNSHHRNVRQVSSCS